MRSNFQIINPDEINPSTNVLLQGMLALGATMHFYADFQASR